jgi:uncharacterized protein (DUF2126 family)/transglutaminase-like putative cysteine protease
MSLQVALHHRTSYRYDRPVALGPQIVRLRPAPHTSSRVLAYSLVVHPKKHFINWQQDPQANYLARLVFPDKTTELSIEVDLVVEMTATNPFDFFLEPSVERWPFEYDESLRDELAPYRRVLPPTPLLAAYLATIPRAEQSTNDLLVGLNQRLASHITYGVRLEPGLQTPEETLAKRGGSCRDTGWLLVHILRHLGFAARFVSGYLIQLVADVKSLDGPSGPEADFVDLHAWCEVYLPGAGWIGLDPTSGLLAGEGHIPLAATAEPSSAAPVSGLVDPAETVFEHTMKVTRIVETPRVTKPYSDAQWSAIVRAGQRVDAALDEGDVRLTMGGEPTFVSIDDPDGAEWNTAALGDDKLRLAKQLFARLRDRHATTGFAHVGQGKWYPGEPLPRWALSLFWRRDGAPLWKDHALLAVDDAKGEADAAAAGVFLRGVAERLGFDAASVLPAYEDTYHYLLRERQLPANVDPLDAKLDDPLERTRLRRLFGEGLGKVAGWVLPVAKPDHATQWRTSPWRFREGHCFLLPGDSPMGLRLPLAALPWADPEKPEADDVVRTAMCAEARGGVLHVFMPPAETLDDYAELLGALEATAKALDQPIRIEGYTPPRDPALAVLAVTPDPGVIEVNVQPEATWDALVDSTTFLYETAHQCRLSAEKFMVDGRHVGTGGGNHVVLGGATPDDSPFLRRPDLLRSFIAHFHQHPSLSYLFSGMFIGPTSQAPRIDEARNDSVYEMEIAFRELGRMVEKHEGEPPPWLVDRLFRDLLTDVTGNTHRAELCIDKMYSPDGSAGRLGLLELRGLEMPPHPRMSLVQQLLLRALVARFWKEPVAPSHLTRWGTTLHDRFMLPFFVWSDFEDVLADLAAHGFALPAEWFAPHYEFRFPVVGELEARGMKLEIRSALEPWHVLGEDAVVGGTARYVDSSVERLQVRVTGFEPDRWSIGCNGVRVPLQPTGREGEHVAGVRFRAWQPPRCLHPHLEVHAPLKLDWVDRWTERSVGGCEIHVAHPGGRNHDERPINALEAEGRRRARFVRHGHTPGSTTLRDAPPSIELPFTLDLRTAQAPTER